MGPDETYGRRRPPHTTHGCPPARDDGYLMLALGRRWRRGEERESLGHSTPLAGVRGDLVVRVTVGGPGTGVTVQRVISEAGRRLPFQKHGLWAWPPSPVPVRACPVAALCPALSALASVFHRRSRRLFLLMMFFVEWRQRSTRLFAEPSSRCALSSRTQCAPPDPRSRGKAAREDSSSPSRRLARRALSLIHI